MVITGRSATQRGDLWGVAPLAVAFALGFGAITWALVTAFDNAFGRLVSGYHQHGQAYYEAFCAALAASVIRVRADLGRPMPLRQFAVGALVLFLPTLFLVSAVSMWDFSAPPALETAVRDACARSVNQNMCGPAFGVITYAKVVRAAPVLLCVTPLLWFTATQANHMRGERT